MARLPHMQRARVLGLAGCAVLVVCGSSLKLQQKMGAAQSSASLPESLVDSLLSAQGLTSAASPSASSSASLAMRKFEVFALATRVVADYKLLQWRCAQIDDETRQNELTEQVHERNAKLLYAKFSSLEALFAKLGQYLSCRADVMPSAYLRELSQCQDSLPAPDWATTRATIEHELQAPLDAIFSSIDSTPLAVASIASVHRATLLDGTAVVVKVQHVYVKEKLLQDLKCLETIGDVVKWLDPDFDFSPVIREWAKEVPAELDFRKEASNMQRVTQNLAPFRNPQASPSLSFKVSLATVIPNLVSEKVLVMGFVDGVKLEKASLDELGADRADVVRQITRAYAQQIFGDGLYSGDPHKGNLLLEKSTLEPFLLDFGLTKSISAEIRYGFSKMIVAADEADIHGLLTALESVGLRLRTDVPFDIALLAKYFFRDAKRAEEAQEENSKRRADWKKEAEEKARILYVGDAVEATTSNLIGWRSTQKGQVVNASETFLDVRLTDGTEVRFDRAACKLQKSRSPIDSWPDAFIFFERVLGLLRGLTASLDVNQSYLDIMTPYARHSLSTHPSASLSFHVADRVEGVDELGVGTILKTGLEMGDLLGAQVVVLKNGKPLVDLTAGAASPYSREPVERDTVFCCFSSTKAVASAAILRLVEEKKVALSDPVAIHWKAFGANGKDKITIHDLLHHRAGLQDAGTEEISRDPFLVTDSNAMIRLMAESIPDPETLGKTRYHYLSFGWLLDGLFQSVTGISLKQYAKEHMGGLNIGIPTGPESERPFRRGYGHPQHKVANLVLHKFAVQPSTAPRDPPKAPLQQSQSSRRPASNPSLLLNPTFFNSERIRASSIPSANGHFSAAELAGFYSNNAAQLAKLLKANPGKETATVAGENLLQGEEGKFRLGLMLYADEGSSIVFGHSGLGGSIGLAHHDLDTGDTITVAVTLNRLNFDAVRTRAIVKQVFTALKLQVPPAFQEKKC